MNTITLPAATIRRLEKLSADTRHTPESIVKQAIKKKAGIRRMGVAAD